MYWMASRSFTCLEMPVPLRKEPTGWADFAKSEVNRSKVVCLFSVHKHFDQDATVRVLEDSAFVLTN